jgi:hypothetical protein
MIASNYRKHPEAAALQLPLPFAHRLVWALPRPGARVLRAIRVARAAAFKAAGRIAYPVKAMVPAWWTAAKKRARALASQVKGACLVLWAEVRVWEPAAESAINSARLIGFNYERDLDQAGDDKLATMANRYRARVIRTRRQKEQRFYNQGCPRCGHNWITLDTTFKPGETWCRCTSCTAGWHPDAWAQAKAEFDAEDD